MILPPIRTTSRIHLGERTFWTWEWKFQILAHTVRFCGFHKNKFEKSSPWSWAALLGSSNLRLRQSSVVDLHTADPAFEIANVAVYGADANLGVGVELVAANVLTRHSLAVEPERRYSCYKWQNDHSSIFWVTIPTTTTVGCPHVAIVVTVC